MHSMEAFWRHLNTCTGHDIKQDIWVITWRINAEIDENDHLSLEARRALIRLKPFIMSWQLDTDKHERMHRALLWKALTTAQS